MVNKIFKNIIKEIKEIFSQIGFFLETNLYAFADIAEFVIPFMMYFLGKNGYNEIVLLLPFMLYFVLGIIKGMANKNGKGLAVPLPKERFTEVDYETGAVNMDADRLQELLLYIADLEDWFEKTGRK